MSRYRKAPESVTSVTPVGSVTYSISDVTDMTDVTHRNPIETNARVKGRNTLFHAGEYEPEKRSQSVTPPASVTPEPACGRCQTDPEREPCAPCPLYGAWLERRRLPDTEGWRAVYRVWSTAVGWASPWDAARKRRRMAEAAAVRDVLTRFPRVLDRWPNYPRVDGGR